MGVGSQTLLIINTDGVLKTSKGQLPCCVESVVPNTMSVVMNTTSTISISISLASSMLLMHRSLPLPVSDDKSSDVVALSDNDNMPDILDDGSSVSFEEHDDDSPVDEDDFLFDEESENEGLEASDTLLAASLQEFIAEDDNPLDVPLGDTFGGIGMCIAHRFYRN